MNVLVRGAVITVAVVAIGGYWMYWGAESTSDQVVVPVPRESAENIPQQRPAVASSVVQTEGVVNKERNDQEIKRSDEPSQAARIASLPALLPTARDLNHSDRPLFDIFEQMSPQVSQWLVPDELVRKWVLAIDLIADEKLPQRHRPLSYPTRVFEVQKIGVVNNKETFQALDQNAQRYTQLVNTMIAFDPRTVGRYYREWRPLLEQAYGELGKNGHFNARITQAIDNVLSIEAQPVSPVLKQPHVLYEYAEPALESRSSLEKAVWRLGDDNRMALQAYLRELKFYL